jgi:hypothetical protein
MAHLNFETVQLRAQKLKQLSTKISSWEWEDYNDQNFTRAVDWLIFQISCCFMRQN